MLTYFDYLGVRQFGLVFCFSGSGYPTRTYLKYSLIGSIIIFVLRMPLSETFFW